MSSAHLGEDEISVFFSAQKKLLKTLRVSLFAVIYEASLQILPVVLPRIPEQRV